MYYVGLDANHRPVLDGPGSLNAETRQGDNAFALLFDIVPSARQAAVEQYVATQGMATATIFAGDMLQAIGPAQDDETALHLLTDAQEHDLAQLATRSAVHIARRRSGEHHRDSSPTGCTRDSQPRSRLLLVAVLAN